MAIDKAVDSTQLNSDLTSVANAIRTKGGTSAQLAFPAGFVSAIDAIPTGGGGVSLDGFFSRTAPSGAVSLPTATRLYGYAFYEHDLITSISAPNVTRIDENAFGYCSELVDVSMPELLYAGMTRSGDSLVSDNNINASTTSNFAFRNCDKLGNIYLPKFLKAGKGMFWQCGYDNSSSTPRVTVIVLPSVTQFGHSACRQGKFKAVDLGPNLTTLANDTFYNATVDVLILRSSTVVSASNRDAVRNIKNLYVPSALVASYATASNWSTDAGSRTVTSIEGSQYENYYADGTPIAS